MAVSDISLTAGMRGSLLSLQSNATSIDRTQERLATGRKVNSALDNPTNFFASQAHINRAIDLSGRMDSVKEAIQNIFAANSGITGITSLLEAASGLASAALGTSSLSDRKAFSLQFDELLDQIDTLSADSGYRGTNLLKSDSLTVNFSDAEGVSTFTIAGFDATHSGLAIEITQGGPDATYSDKGNNGTPLSPPAPIAGFNNTFDVAMRTVINNDIQNYRFVGNSSGAIAIATGFNAPVTDPNVAITGTIVSGTFETQENFTVEYYSGGVDQTTGQPLGSAGPFNPWTSDANIQKSQDQVSDAMNTMRSNAKTLASNSSILTTRLDFTSSLTGILQSGADNLTLADMNEEGANMLMLQTRQQLGTSSLSMGAQAAQSVLRLF